ncbi:cystinosin homolog isoform X2 [Benincasa hispida]|uniref:cystinosin homolog isoform X2 n=1 Tax=Benincasa hispida TaxID=102211 RepID=UPI00190159E2|nr:cystinosin homolog isoform X2 [Benincasa hispida]
MGSWNSISMEIIYQVLGWISIICWALASYPQVILNFRRKSSTVQRQYFDKYGYDQMIPVALSDVFFPFHSILLISVVSVQIVFFDVSGLFSFGFVSCFGSIRVTILHSIDWILVQRGNQKVSKTSIAIFVAVWFFAAACFFMALPTHSWLWLVSIFNSIQVFMTFIKYSPQAFLNFTRKSTVGFSIGNIVLDFTGGVGTLAQMSVQSIDQGSWVNFFGNIGKPLLALVSIGFDLIFFYQHFVLYHIKASRVSFQRDPESTEPLIKDSDHLQGIATTS